MSQKDDMSQKEEEISGKAKLLFAIPGIPLCYFLLKYVEHSNHSALFIFFGVCYLIPSLVACYRDSKDLDKLVTLNFIFGWTVIGWFLCLHKALFSETEKEYKLRMNSYSNVNIPEYLRRDPSVERTNEEKVNY